eukprot:COSAG02_NODE_10829_length_1849_cov_14.262286_1_plen_63_part_00
MTGDLSPFLWPLKQSGVDEIFLPPLGQIAAEGDGADSDDAEEEALNEEVEDIAGEEGAAGGD